MTSPNTSQARIEANRRNAQQSTGPRSAAGKRRAALNALRHGLDAATVVLPGEDAAVFAALGDDLAARWRPDGVLEQRLVERLAELMWRRQRLGRVEAGLLTELLAGLLADDAEDAGGGDPVARWDRLGRMETRLDRACERTRRELREAQAAVKAAAQTAAKTRARDTAGAARLESARARALRESASLIAMMDGHLASRDAPLWRNFLASVTPPGTVGAPPPSAPPPAPPHA